VLVEPISLGKELTCAVMGDKPLGVIEIVPGGEVPTTMRRNTRPAAPGICCRRDAPAVYEECRRLSLWRIARVAAAASPRADFRYDDARAGLSGALLPGGEHPAGHDRKPRWCLEMAAHRRYFLRRNSCVGWSKTPRWNGGRRRRIYRDRHRRDPGTSIDGRRSSNPSRPSALITNGTLAILADDDPFRRAAPRGEYEYRGAKTKRSPIGGAGLFRVWLLFSAAWLMGWIIYLIQWTACAAASKQPAILWSYRSAFRPLIAFFFSAWPPAGRSALSSRRKSFLAPE